MKINEFLTPQLTHCNTPAASKKRVLEFISDFMAEQLEDIDSNKLYQSFLFRERIGSTGIGNGVAIPHCRLPGCSTITGAFLKLSEAVDFDAIDEQPVDLVFALVVPEEQQDEHLNVLAAIAELLQDDIKRQQLRDANSAQDLFDLATEELTT